MAAIFSYLVPQASGFMQKPSGAFEDFCRRHYGPPEPKAEVSFDVIDSKDESVRLTRFAMKYDGSPRDDYRISEDGVVTMEVPLSSRFSVQILSADGYVDGAPNSYTRGTLDGSHIGMTRRTLSAAVEFKLDWDIGVSQDLDSHVVVKDGNGAEIGHVFYGNTSYEDGETRVTLDIDNVARSDSRPPEIVTIERPCGSYSYYFYVHDFSESRKLPKTGLNLNVVMDNRSVDPPLAIPAEDSPNSYWNVCKIQGNELVRASDALSAVVTPEPDTSY